MTWVGTRSVGPDIIEQVLRNYDAAMADYVAEHKSRHWDVFSDHHRELISHPETWDDFRSSGLSDYFDATNERRDEEKVIIDQRDRARYITTYDSLVAKVGRENVHALAEASIGKPIHLPHDGMSVNLTDLRLTFNALRIHAYVRDLGLENPVICEIGGGYGGLAAKLKILIPQARIIILDLPEVLACSNVYLRLRFPEAKVAGYADIKEAGIQILDAPFDFAFLPGWIAGQLAPESVDVFINCRSMMEMNRDIVRGYMENINRCTRVGGFFYCANRYEKAKTDHPIRIKEYDFDQRWYLAISEPLWDQETSIHEALAVRTPVATALPPRLAMRDLPPFGMQEIVRSSRMLLGMISWVLRNVQHRLYHQAITAIYVPALQLAKRRCPGLVDGLRILKQGLGK